MNPFRMILVLFLMLILCSCSQEEAVFPHTLENTTRFDRKKLHADLTLECGRIRLDYVSGKKGQTMKMILKNKGLTPVSIDEWYMEDTENFRLFYAACEKGKSANLPETAWKQGWPLKKKQEHGRHMPVCLNPNQGLVLDVPMDFLKNLPQRKPVEHVAVYVELSLKSVSLRSPVYEIEVRPIVHQY